ncbi:MAG: DUF1232 domain-containing protein [Clostridiales bacterium]|nr:DUF1232 domain-containing protein [Clostridiales bacterium]
MRFIFWRVLGKRIKAIPSFMKDKSVPIRKKLVIAFGLLYLLSPIDLIPTPILLFGIIDDLVIWLFIIHYFKEELDKYWIGEQHVKPEKEFAGKKIINDVDFEVKEDPVDKKEQ